MTMLKVSLGTEDDLFIEEQVRSGAYADAETVIRAGLERLRQDEALRGERFQSKIQEGLDDLAAGRVEEVSDVSAWLAGVARRPG